MSGYSTCRQCVAVEGVADLEIRSLLNRDQYFDPHQQAARLGISSAHWPLFGLLWPSSAQLAARMALRLVQHGEKIIEIGCGLALPSLVAHRRGADVTASDRHPLTASFLRQNLRLNRLSPMKYLHQDWTGHAPSIGAPPGPSGFDLIIGSDVLYERDVRGSLAALIGRLAKDRAEVLIVDPDRSNRPDFNRRMAALGFAREEMRLYCEPTAHGTSFKGRLLTYRR